MKKLNLKKVALAEMPAEAMSAVQGGKVEKEEAFLPTLISILSLPFPVTYPSIFICI